jgi:hypothetical protein
MKCVNCGDMSRSIFDWELNRGRLECPKCGVFERINVSVNGEEKSFGRVVSAKKFIKEKLEGVKDIKISGGSIKCPDGTTITSNVRLAYLID